MDISNATGNPTDTASKIDGLYTILDAFKFTVTENTPIEEEIALDPELLGRIFENLLAEYNPETEKTARKQTGSFYTPRDIVDYMVNESLKVYLHSTLCRKLPTVTPADASEGLDILFTYTEREHAFTDAEKHVLVDAIYNAVILDPACGSGAFPIGMLQKLVYVLDKLDHDHWKQRILADTPAAMKEQTRKWLDSASADFAWKLGLIQHSIYGIDIQPFAVQIAKLRCFVSLLVDFNVDPTADNCGVPSLPNLDFKFVAANTLISLPNVAEHADDLLKLEDPFLRDFAVLAEEYFFVRDPVEKKRLQDKIEVLIEQQIETHTNTRVNVSKAYLEENKRSQKLWESYRNIFAFRNSHVGFFELRYFFPEIKDGFDIVIGNPPYVRTDEQSEWNRDQRQAILASRQYETLWEKWDLFIPFLERGYKLLREGGICALIVSDAYCHSKYAQKSQNWFLTHSRILRLDFCGDLKIFEASVHNIIPFFQKADGADNTPKRRLHKETFGNITLLPTDKQQNLTCRTFFPQTITTQTQHHTHMPCVSLESIYYTTYGLRPSNAPQFQRFLTKDLVSSTRTNIHTKKYIEGKHIDRWLIREHLWLEWGTYRAPDQFYAPTFNELYMVPEKIIAMRSPGANPMSVYDDDMLVFTPACVGFVPWHSLSGVRNNSLKKAARYAGEKPPRPDLPKREQLEENSRRFNIKFLLGVMNSATARDYLRAHRRSNIHLYPNDWKCLPIPDIPTDKQMPITALVDCILTAKRANPTADVTALESEIDALVNALYKLTPAKIKPVEETHV